MVAIYARQFIDKKDSISIDTQIELCKRQLPDGIPCVVYPDKGYSGSNINRPEFQRLLEDVKSGKIDRIITYRLDRIRVAVVMIQLGRWIALRPDCAGCGRPLITQGAHALYFSVNIVQHGVSFWYLFLFILVYSYSFLFIPAEGVVAVAEALLSRRFLTGQSKTCAVVYGLTANAASAVLGFFLAEPVWQFVASIS